MTLRYLTAGESHGRGLAGILEGLPAGLALPPSPVLPPSLPPRPLEPPP
jgi:chorismate synthase